jgi:type I restriction enzyme S subunit
MSSKTKFTATKKEATPALVPKLRFPEFTEAAGWETTPLGELGAIVTGKTPSTKEDDLWGGVIPFITPTDITEGEKYQHKTQRTVVETTGTKVLPPGSVVYTCIASIGKMALTVVPSVTNQQINAVVPNGKTAKEFIYYSLANLTPWIKSIPATSTLPIINKTQFSGFIIPHPEDKAEQQKIAECLSSVDELIAAQARKLDALKTHKKGLMQQLFPREGETQPRLRFPEFEIAGEWGEEKLEDLAKRGSGHTPNKTKDEYYNGGIKWVSLADSKRLDNGLISETTIVISEQGIKKSSAVLHPAGSVILSRDAGVGKSAVMNESMAVSQHFIVWTCDKRRLSNWFLYYILQIKKPVFENVASGSTIKTIGLPFFKEMRISVPQVKEQQRIADCLTSLDDLIAAQTQKHEALKTHKKGLMQQLFPSLEEVAI